MPARFAGGASGLQAFDLDSYLSMVQRNRKWQDPTTLQNGTVEQLQVGVGGNSSARWWVILLRRLHLHLHLPPQLQRCSGEEDAHVCVDRPRLSTLCQAALCVVPLTCPAGGCIHAASAGLPAGLSRCHRCRGVGRWAWVCLGGMGWGRLLLR